MKKQTNKHAERLWLFLSPVLTGYAEIFFSSNRFVGLIFLAATFVVPAHGAAGLSALALSNLWAFLLGFSEDHIKQGYFAYNGLLTGLALGLFYRVNAAFFIMLLIATLLGVLLAASLRSLFERYLFIPVLSLPFVLTTWIVIAAGRQFHGLIYSLEPLSRSWLSGMLPSAVEFFVRSLGAAFFQLNIPSGILIALGLLIFSRQAFILAVIGLVSGSVTYLFLKGNPSSLTSGLIGFNFALTAIAVGGIWTVPGIRSLILAAVSGAVCAITAASIAFLLRPLGLPPVALPFVATTSFVIYALKHASVEPRFTMVTIPDSTPEKNLKRHKNARARFITGEIPVFNLPVSGLWTITQGFDGEYTHKDLWRHAWDFEVIDEEGGKYRKEGTIPENYYSYGMPVFSPADGKVITVISHIEDNPVGQINTENNWGNVVIIWHYGSVYTALCHLKPGSIVVNEGEVLRYGQTIGKVGNSGRSPVPHLHFQVQASHEIGAPTIASELMHYTEIRNGVDFYHTHGCPVEGDKISALQTESALFDAASFPLGRSWAFRAHYKGREWEEIWETEIDLLGNRFLVCREQHAHLRFMVNRKVLLFLDYDGPRNTGLYWLFMSVPRLPMTTAGMQWEEELPAEMILPKAARLIFDLVEPFYSPARLASFSKLDKSGRKIFVETVLNATGPLALRNHGKITTTSGFELHRGFHSLTARRGGETLFELARIGVGHEDAQWKWDLSDDELEKSAISRGVAPAVNPRGSRSREGVEARDLQRTRFRSFPE